MIRLKIFKASEGDSILVSFGENREINIMIDMGLDTTYLSYIKPELIKLNKMNKKLNLLVISHVDKDHIMGAIEFIKENKNTNQIISVDEVWHNTYRHINLENKKEDNISSRNSRIIKEIIDSNTYKKYNNGGVNITAEQGMALGGYLLKYNYNWNTSFEGKSASIENSEDVVIIEDSVKVILLSPNKEKLDKLGKKWIRDLKDKYNVNSIGNGQEWDDAFDFYMSNLRDDSGTGKDISEEVYEIKNISDIASISEKDGSYINGASISFIIEYKNNKLLFLGDSHEDIIYTQLVELMNTGYDLSFDAVKVSHHGSNKNISQRLVDLIESKMYIFSTDGKKHQHPNIEAIAKILNRKNKKPIELSFNYDIQKIEYLTNQQLKDTYKYEIKILNENEYITIQDGE